MRQALIGGLVALACAGLCVSCGGTEPGPGDGDGGPAGGGGDRGAGATGLDGDARCPADPDPDDGHPGGRDAGGDRGQDGLGSDVGGDPGDDDDNDNDSDSDDDDDGDDDGARLGAPGWVDTDPWDSPTLELEISEASWDALHEDVTADVEVPVVVRLRGHTYDEVALELQGYSSRYFEKKNFKLKFEHKTDLGVTDTPLKAKKLILKGNWKDHTLLRESLSWRALAQLGHPVPATGWVHLKINGKDYGLYVTVEAVDESWFARRGYAKGGNLYKGVNQKASFAPKYTLEQGFEKKEGDDPDDWSDLEAFVDLVHGLPETPSDADVFGGIDPIFDVTWFLERLVWMAYTQNSDGVSQNFYLYNEPGHSQDHWVMTAWDGDIAFSAHWRIDRLSSDWWANPLLNGKSFLAQRLVANDTVRAELIQRLQLHLTGTYCASEVRPWVEALEERLAGDIGRDLERWNRGYSVAQVLAPIYSFVEHRPGFLLDNLDEFAEDPWYEP